MTLISILLSILVPVAFCSGFLLGRNRANRKWEEKFDAEKKKFISDFQTAVSKTLRLFQEDP